MSRPLIVKSLEERQRIYRRVYVAVPLVALGILAGSAGLEMTPSMLVTIVLPFLIGIALFFFILRHTRLAETRHEEAMRALGLSPVVGEFTAGLARWPAEGFTLFDEKPWAVGIAFHHEACEFRTFQGATGGEARQDISGAAIRIPGARFPSFAIEKARRGLLSSTPPSTASFREDRTFADDFAVVAADPRQLERELPAAVLRLWRTMPGWRMQGSGEWVLAWSEERVTAAKAPHFVAQLCALAEALRDGQRAGEASRPGTLAGRR